MKKKIENYGDLLIRVVAGLIFVVAGYNKLSAIDGFVGMLSGIGFPAAVFFAYLVAIVELIGGLMLILGLYTYIAAIALAVVMAFAILTVHLGQGWSGYRYPLLLLVVLIRYVGTHGFGNTMSIIHKK